MRLKVGELKKLREERALARRRPPQPRSPETAAQHEASQQDEAEVSDEMGARRDPDSGEQAVDERAALKAGAVDTESVVENRRLNSIVAAKRSGKRDVHINVDDVLIKYDTILRVHAADSLYISVKRVSGGAPVQQTVAGYPRNGRDLYEAIKVVHGRHDVATYQVNFFDANSKEYRGKGQITMPDTRDPAAQGQPMYPPYGYPPGGQPPPPPPGYGQSFQQQAPQAAPQGQDFGGLLAGFRQLMEMMQSYQAGGYPTQQPTASPPGAPGDFSAQLDSLRNMIDMLQGQAGGRPGPRGVAQPVVNPQMAAAMAGMGMPPVQPPPGMIWVPGFGFMSLEALMRAAGASGPAAGPGGYRGGGGPYRGPFQGGAGVGGEDPQQQRGPSQYPPSFMRGGGGAAEPPRSAADQFRDSVALFRTVSTAAREVGSMFSGQEPSEPDAVSSEDDASPVRVVDTGGAKLVINKKDGSLRTWETGFANVGPLLKWAADQVESARQKQQQPPPRQALPEGYVEVTPGYRPPPGFVAVPEQPPPPGFAPSPLPPPPADMPPPLGGFAPSARPIQTPRQTAAPPQAPPSRTWGVPTIP